MALAQFLIEEGALQKEKGYPRALTKAARHGHLILVEYLANFAEGRMDETDDLGRTPIMYASWNGHLAVVGHLANVGADVTLATTAGESALTLAAASGHLPVVKWLMNLSTGRNSRQAIIEAVEDGHLLVVDHFVANGSHFKHANRDGSMLLMKAASKGHLATVKFFVESGMDVNYIDDSGNTALTLAAFGGWIAIVDYMVGHGAEFNHFGVAAIMKAAKTGRLDILEYLFDNLATTDAVVNMPKFPPA